MRHGPRRLLEKRASAVAWPSVRGPSSGLIFASRKDGSLGCRLRIDRSTPVVSLDRAAKRGVVAELVGGCVMSEAYDPTARE